MIQSALLQQENVGPIKPSDVHQVPALKNFIKMLMDAFQKGTEHCRVDEKEVNTLFERFTHSDVASENFALEALAPYCYVDPTKNYTRNLITENEHFSLMVLCWNPFAKR
jgi:hypothetical protein